MKTCPLSRLALALSALALASCNQDPATAPHLGDPEPTPQLAAAAVNSWARKAPMPTARGYLAAGVTNSPAGQILYAIGGMSAEPSFTRHSLRTVEAYDLGRNTWTTRASLPLAPHSTNGVGMIGGTLYVSGGLTLVAGDDISQRSKALYVYNPPANRWSRKADMPSTSADGISGVIEEKLYVLTDVCALSTCSNTNFPTQLWRYDPSSNTWNKSLRPCPTNHRAGAGGVIAGKLYAVGGSLSNPRTQRLHVYDPVTNRWIEKAALPTNLMYLAGAVTGNKLYVMGGVGSAGSGRTMYMYNSETDRWTTKAPMPTARSGLAAARVTLADGQRRIVAVGGHGSSINEAYTP